MARIYSSNGSLDLYTIGQTLIDIAGAAEKTALLKTEKLQIVQDSQTSFTMEGSPIGGTVLLFLNGQQIAYQDDYLISESQITLLFDNLDTSDALTVTYLSKE